jgi:integrase/recombinase XerD
MRYLQSRGAFHSRSTVAGVTSTLKLMGEFLVQEAVWLSNPLRWMRGPKMDSRRRVPRRITQEQQRALWSAAEGRRQEHARHQAICVLAILYGTGLRRGELARLDVDDWDREAGVLRIDGRKTGVERCVPVPEAVWRCIEAYLPHRHNRLELHGHLAERALLVNAVGERLGSDGSARLVARLCRDAGLPTLTMHQFRHSCASDLLEAGVSIPDVQRVLGHACVVSTLRYTAVADPQRALAISRHPINQFLALPAEERRAS